jgi:hypothetical protein
MLAGLRDGAAQPGDAGLPWRCRLRPSASARSLLGAHLATSTLTRTVSRSGDVGCVVTPFAHSEFRSTDQRLAPTRDGPFLNRLLDGLFESCPEASHH